MLANWMFTLLKLIFGKTPLYNVLYLVAPDRILFFSDPNSIKVIECYGVFHSHFILISLLGTADKSVVINPDRQPQVQFCVVSHQVILGLPVASLGSII